jgi:hypothetical protein
VGKQFKKTVRGSACYREVNYKVRGFWRHRQITVYQSAHLVDGAWGKPEIERSGGGHDLWVCSLIEAERNFAAALLDAIEEAEKLQKRVGQKATGRDGVVRVPVFHWTWKKKQIVNGSKEASHGR